MNELDHLNPDLMQAEVAYRREQLIGEHRAAVTGTDRWRRLRRRARRAQNR